MKAPWSVSHQRPFTGNYDSDFNDSDNSCFCNFPFPAFYFLVRVTQFQRRLVPFSTALGLLKIATHSSDEKPVLIIQDVSTFRYTDKKQVSHFYEVGIAGDLIKVMNPLRLVNPD